MAEKTSITTSLHRLRIIARALSSRTVSPVIRVDPSDALIDEPVSIDVSGLQQGQKVTLSATLRNNNRDFLSCAHYTADVKGQVNTAVQPSEGGSFTGETQRLSALEGFGKIVLPVSQHNLSIKTTCITGQTHRLSSSGKNGLSKPFQSWKGGIEPMGLFWSMTPSAKHRKGVRLVKTDVTSPLIVCISVISNHNGLSSIESETDTMEVLSSTQVKRWYIGTGVQRIPLREGRLRGALFIPPGNGPFPAILDMFGGSGGLFDFRAAVLASRGFLTLSLPYLVYEDLPTLDKLDFGYFTEAADWLRQHRKAAAGGIGVIGSSLGASLAYMLATYCPQIQAVVAINGPPLSPLRDQEIQGEWVKKGNTLIFSRGDDGYAQSTFGLNELKTEILPIWKQNVKILSFMSGDDKSYSPERYRSQMDRIPGDKRGNIECIVYPGAGHLLEPPYTPLCHQSHIAGEFEGGIQGLMFLWGGEAKSHAVAQEDAWRRTLQHFNTHLGNNTTMTSLET